MSQEPFRMIINDTYLIKGCGTLVAGIIESGSIKKDDKVILLSTENKALITSVIGAIPRPHPQPITEEWLIESQNSRDIGLLIYSEKFHAVAKKGMYLVSASANPKIK